MKLKKLLFIGLFLLILTTNVYANTIYSIDMDIYLDENANANITEIWKVKGTDGTEWYKPLRSLGESKLSDFTVSMDGKPLTYKNWNIYESLSEKAGYYGINYTSLDTELCFGKSDYEEHTFTVKYKLSNYIFNASDSQILYWTFFPKFQQVDFQNLKITIRSFYEFPNTLDVWSYGFKGYAYVDGGVITFTNEDYPSMNNQYAVGLVKFPLNTFNTSYTVDYYQTFSDVKKAADEGSFKYDYNDVNYNGNNNYNSNSNKSILSKIFNFFLECWYIIPIMLGIGGTIKYAYNNQYGYKNNKTIDKKNVPFFRDIPCDKDIYYANALVCLNNFDYKEANILGAIILKWIREEKVKFIKQETGLFKKETSCIDMRLNPTFTINIEERLFRIMYEASGDGILEPKEFEKWAKRNYSRFFDLFKELKDNKVNELRTNGHIYTRTTKEECKFKNVMDDTLYEESTRLYGLKKFLQEFSNIDSKETLEVHLWDEYLMFAYIFGIADKVAKQIKNLYPNLLEQNNIDFDTIIIINNISTNTVHAASSARSAAENYHSGGGGFGMGGGGGGSFGGGGFSGGGSR